MQQLLKQLAAYNVWANHRLSYHLLQMPEQTWMQKTPSSFDSLFKTILHMWDAESAWWQRMRNHEHIIIPSQNFDPGMKDACNGLLHQSMEWEQFVLEQLTDEILQSNLYYQNSKGEHFAQPVYEVVMHVFNHTNYHRGQLVTMMRQLGETNLPPTDFIHFTRRKEP
jgi:uncharacterized damage-inducible protein DinB